MCIFTLCIPRGINKNEKEKPCLTCWISTKPTLGIQFRNVVLMPTPASFPLHSWHSQEHCLLAQAIFFSLSQTLTKDTLSSQENVNRLNGGLHNLLSYQVHCNPSDTWHLCFCNPEIAEIGSFFKHVESPFIYVLFACVYPSFQLTWSQGA